jgi:hypothetical protein
MENENIRKFYWTEGDKEKLRKGIQELGVVILSEESDHFTGISKIFMDGFTYLSHDGKD